MPSIGVSISGGGHRATLFGLGVLQYLAHAKRNDGTRMSEHITAISSASGGSITNAYIGQEIDFRTASTSDVDHVAARLAFQIADRGTFFAPWPVRLYVVLLVLSGLAGLGGLLWVLLMRSEWTFGMATLAAGSVGLLIVA